MQNSIGINELTLIPFILMLSSIALLPLIAEKFWDRNRNKLLISVLFSIPVVIYLISNRFTDNLYETIVFDYIPFIILLSSLFVITGGIYIEGDIEAKPSINTKILAVGAILSSLLGTTGAAMLLIRFILRTNTTRKYKVHTVLFFIAIIANCGGLLTPLADPPLFMLYLRGVPFTWFFNFFWVWLYTNGMLLIIFYFVDSYYWKKEDQTVKDFEKKSVFPIKIHGKTNFIYLAGIIMAIGLINSNTFEFIKHNHYFSYFREIFIVSMALCSLFFSAKINRQKNDFNWHPINEVIYIFLGIFITMIPCLMYLETNSVKIGIDSTHLFYYLTGILSSFLDNTPTAITFYSLAEGLKLNAADMIIGVPAEYMKAICTGAVLFGSMTYIGNGPNFMIKAIAENQNVKMPHFFEYIFKFSIIVLLPVFISVHLIFG